MTRALKIVLAAYGIGISVAGILHFIFAEVDPERALGAGLIAMGPFLFIAARDPIRNILWVRFAIVFALLFFAVALYIGAVIRGEFQSSLVGILIHGTFALLLLIFYPRQTVRGHGRTASRATRSGTVVEVTD